MLPRFYSGPSHRISKAGLARHARVASTNKQSGISRHTVVEANCRLVLRPTGNGSYDHIGDEVSLPQTIPLKDGVFEVGRAAPADIQINVPTVSSRHALLRVEDNKISITDLNSTNGTVVNGQELTPMDDLTVGVGSEVIFGDMYLARFLVDEVPDHLLQEQLAVQQQAAALATSDLSDQLSAPQQQSKQQLASEF